MEVNSGYYVCDNIQLFPNTPATRGEEVFGYHHCIFAGKKQERNRILRESFLLRDGDPWVRSLDGIVHVFHETNYYRDVQRDRI